MFNFVKILYSVLLICFASINLKGNSPVRINSGFEHSIIEPKIEYKYSTDSLFDEFKFKTFIFKPFHKDSIKQGKSSYWLKFTIDNQSSKEEFLALGTSLFHFISLYYKDSYDEVYVSKSGIKENNNRKQIFQEAHNLLTFTVPENKVTEIFLFVRNISKIEHQYSPLDFTLYGKETIDSQLKNSNWVITFFLGAIVIMSIYNFALYFIVRKDFYLLYIINNIAIIFFVLTQSGILEKLYFNSFSQHEELVLVMANISVTTYMLFSKSILNFKRYDPPWEKRINYGLIVWTALLGFVGIGMIKTALILTSIGAIIGYNIILIATYKAIKNGSEPAKFFLIGNAFYYIGLTISIFQINGYLPYRLFGLSPIEYIEITTLIQLGLFSLTLGSRINSMRDKIIRKELEKNIVKQEEERKFSRLIQQKNAELEIKVVQRTHELREFAQIIEQKNLDIMDSMNYAKRIQTALLPDNQTWNQVLQKSFVLYQPKDIISGDFYWLNQSKIDDTLFFAACDCTGHGVPGAMVSVVGYNNLNRCVNEFGLSKPSDILNQLNVLVEEAFEMGQNQDDIKDGMDIALCSLKYYPKYEKGKPLAKLQYAGANNPLWLLRNAETTPASENRNYKSTKRGGHVLIEIKADKQPIGKFHQRTPFNNNEFDLYEDDQLFIFSDGYVDQFGGPKGKKFKTGQFREMLFDIQDLDSSSQKSHLFERLETWRGHEEQVDDICVVGVRI